MPLALENGSKGTSTYPLLNVDLSRVDLPVVTGVSVSSPVLKEETGGRWWVRTASIVLRYNCFTNPRSNNKVVLFRVKGHTPLSFCRQTTRACAPCVRKVTWVVYVQGSRVKTVDWLRVSVRARDQLCCCILMLPGKRRDNINSMREINEGSWYLTAFFQYLRQNH